MTNQNQTETGKSPEKSLMQDASKKTTPDSLQENPRSGDACEKLKAEPDGEETTTKSAMLILWLFIASLIIASLVAGYLLWAKLSFRSP